MWALLQILDLDFELDFDDSLLSLVLYTLRSSCAAWAASLDFSLSGAEGVRPGVRVLCADSRWTGARWVVMTPHFPGGHPS